MMSPQAPQHEPHDPVSNDTEATIPPYEPKVFQRQMRLDALVRWSIVVAVVAYVMVAVFAEAFGANESSVLSILILLVLGGAWVAASLNSAKVWQRLGGITAMLEQSPKAAEREIAWCLRRWPLHRAVRLLVYHRLAVLRHRQQRFAEAAAICQAVLAWPLGAAEQARPHLLLMLVEAKLECGDLVGAYHGLLGLYRARLSFMESLQRMALQIRYQLTAGYDDLTLQGIGHKIQLAEMMPAPQCGVMHAMLALAAKRAKRGELAKWLQRRADLLCWPQQLKTLAPGSEFLNVPHFAAENAASSGFGSVMGTK